MTIQSAIDAWRDRIIAHDSEATALRSGHGPGQDHHHDDHEDSKHDGGHVHGGHGGFSYTNRPRDVHRTDDPAVNGLFALIDSDTTVLDVGGGAGRFALPLATRAKHVTVVEPSDEAVGILRERAAAAGLSNITVVNERWEVADIATADLVLCSLVLHHVPEGAAFITKLQERASGRVAIIEMMEPPSALEVPFYERVYGAVPTPMPGVPELLDLLWAMDIHPDVTMLPPETAVMGRDRDEITSQIRRRLDVEEHTPEDSRLLAALDELLEETPNGYTVTGIAPRRPAIITWTTDLRAGK
ncbi:MAG: class I SAM-dependent methyltransferase [Chloroflexi bacterium]|nr:class I SAM-dependent methyltransferase [Chloroflexota bacterium]